MNERIHKSITYIYTSEISVDYVNRSVSKGVDG